jgi:CRISPR-associated protein Csd1
MSWMQRLNQTYQCAFAKDLAADDLPVPPAHTIQNAHINIVIDQEGNFRRASVLEKTRIILPATELSENRTGNDAPHALSETIQYVAKDYNDYGGEKQSFFKSYSDQLRAWCESEYSHPKACAVYKYIVKGKVVADLIHQGVLVVDSNNQYVRSWTNKEAEAPKIFSYYQRQKGQ